MHLKREGVLGFQPIPDNFFKDDMFTITSIIL